MTDSALLFRVSSLQSVMDLWLLEGDFRCVSPNTQYARRYIIGELAKFCSDRNDSAIDGSCVRAFLADMKNRRSLKPGSMHKYYTVLHAFFQFALNEELADSNPMAKLARPINRRDQIQPFSVQQQNKLIEYSQTTPNGLRDHAIVLLLLDSGLRAEELCRARLSDFSLPSRSLRIRGKGDKVRIVYLGKRSTQALVKYLHKRPTTDSDCIFVTLTGMTAREPLTRSGLRQLVRKIGVSAGITGVRCSPHTCRHTFAINFLMNGANIFTLKELLGHSTLAMVNNYVALAQVDLQAQHALYSPMDRLKTR